MSRPKLLDLFCGPGGASAGYVRAGFEVMGVDIDANCEYPYRFINADALTITNRFIRSFDVVHASPPCFRWSTLNAVNRRWYDDLITPTRLMLGLIGIPYVLENVVGAPLKHPFMLCGQMFGIRVIRHRNFETTIPIDSPPHVPHTDFIPYKTPDKHGGWSRKPFADALGVTWCKADKAGRAIPPAYTEYIGREILCRLNG